MPMYSRVNTVVMKCISVSHTSILVLFRLSASCTDVSGLLPALAALALTQFPPSSATDSSTYTKKSEENLPASILSMPVESTKTTNESNLKMTDATFEKYVYSRAASSKKHQRQDFDPQSQKYRGNANAHFRAFLSQG